MNLRGRDRYENLSHQGGPREGPPVRFGDYVVPSAAAWVLVPTGKSPGVRAEFEMRNGRPVCLSVAVQAVEGGRTVTTADLATLPGLDRKAIDTFRELGTRVYDDEDWREGRNLTRADAIMRPDRRAVAAALRQQSDEELQKVADIYREHVNQAPVDAVRDALDVSRATASRRIREARDRGFLPMTSQGKRRA